MARMKNEEIIFLEWCELVEQGIIEETEHIHTYQTWKKLGYQVCKGETAIAKFPIWKYSKRKPAEGEDVETVKGGFFFLKVSAFFCDRQVALIEKTEK